MLFTMQLSPLQSRLIASLAASFIVLALYLFLFSPQLASASELPVPADSLLALALEGEAALQSLYEPEFSLFDRSIAGRVAPSSATGLDNNEPKALNLDRATATCYSIDEKIIFRDDDSSNNRRELTVDERGQPVRRQNSPKTIYISATTCLQPFKAEPKQGEDEAAPQLKIYVSSSGAKECPDPADDDFDGDTVEFNDGAAMYSANVTGSIYYTISAPNVSDSFGGVYNFETAFSTDDYYHSYDTTNTTELLWMDSDSNSALLFSRNLTTDPDQTEAIMKAGMPYSLYVDNDDWPVANGLRHSACGLSNTVQIAANRNGQKDDDHVATSELTTNGAGGFPKQQFFLEGLNSSSSYSGILVSISGANGTNITEKRSQPGVVGGGGKVYSPTFFNTRNKSEYTTPGDESRFSTEQLTKKYDNFAKKAYANFEKALAQTQCEAEDLGRYSLARDCDDCRSAYKRWLCTVAIPRCEDYSYDNEYAIFRNIGASFPNGTKLPKDIRESHESNPYNNASRNKWIDDEIRPGPYKEILPCEDLCYEVVQSCPAALGFGCPQPHMVNFNASYGQRHGNSTTSCNYPGEARTPISAAAAALPQLLFVAVFSGCVMMTLL